MQDGSFSVTPDGPVTHVTLTRPEKRNALDLDFWESFPATLEEIDAPGTARAIILSGDGPHFCSGIDLQAFSTALDSGHGDSDTHRTANRGQGLYQIIRRMQNCFSALENIRIPVLAAIQGGCIGGGVDMVAACDMRYCTEDAWFTIYEINIGMTADVGTFPRILNHLPEGVVRELAYTGRKMPADEAFHYGLVNEIYSSRDEMMQGVGALAAEIASKAPLAIHGCKDIITHARDHSTQETLDRIALWNANALHGSEIMTAIAAEKTGQPGDFAPLPPKNKLSGK